MAKATLIADNNPENIYFNVEVNLLELEILASALNINSDTILRNIREMGFIRKDMDMRKYSELGYKLWEELGRAAGYKQ